MRTPINAFFPFFSGRCCCFCFGHLVLFATAAMQSYIITFAPSDVREVVKLQKTIDKINASVDMDKTMTSLIRVEANSSLRKAVIGGKPIKWLESLVRTVAPRAGKSLPAELAELQDEIMQSSSSSSGTSSTQF